MSPDECSDPHDDCAKIGDATNKAKTISYWPMEPYAEGCRAMGASFYFPAGSSLSGGTGTTKSNTPPGFYCLPNSNRARGHVVANCLGGSGSNPRNIFPQFQQNSNSPNQRDIEMDIADAVKGQSISGTVELIYLNFYDPRPAYVLYTAVGSGGLDISCIVPNAPNSSTTCTSYKL